jgi:hypothetical protein
VNIPHDDFHRTLLDSNRKKEKVEEMKLILSSIYQKVSLRLVTTSSMMMGGHVKGQLSCEDLASYRTDDIESNQTYIIYYAPCVWKNSLLQICKLNICAFQRKAPFD